ncbi:transposase family protein [Streptomyces mirabilis]|uniref:transposase family protein n=1 Tax=Streptomyces mirabilis TaxID=68239 RepID=UPI0033D3B939
MVAVLGGAASLAVIARFATDTESDLREQLGLISSTPSASTLGRVLARLSTARPCADPAPTAPPSICSPPRSTHARP